MSERGIAKGVIARVLASDVISPLTRRFRRSGASIMMMHRFADRDRGNAGHDPAMLRRHLEYLRRRRYDLVSLADLVQRLISGDKRLGRSVVFTIDDGYADYAAVAAPIFEAFDCPATVFIVTGVVDDAGWYWWDRVRVALERTPRRQVTLDLSTGPLRLAWSHADAVATSRALVERLKSVADAERRAVVDSLPGMMDVDIPARPPAMYASMTWDDVRRCGATTTTFGPHTVSHPILARTDDATARFEITESWRRLAQQTTAAIPVFCYPNGEFEDAGPREFAIARDAGIDMAVTTRPGYASRAAWGATPDARFGMPRFGYPDDTLQFVQIVNGVEGAKRRIRDSLRSWSTA